MRYGLVGVVLDAQLSCKKDATTGSFCTRLLGELDCRGEKTPNPELEKGYVCCVYWGVRLSSAPLSTDNLARSSDGMPSAHLDTVNMRLDVAPRFQVQHMYWG